MSKKKKLGGHIMSGMKFEKEIFMKYLIEREASEATKKKYMTDVTTFYSYAAEAEEIDKELLLAYREWLMQHYAVSSVNSMLVALNQYLLAVGLGKWKLRRVRVQGCNSKMMERELQKSDYIKLVRKAKEQGKEQLVMIMETLAGTGIRISELRYFSVDSVQRGIVKVWNKGKYRSVILTDQLRKRLLYYIRKNKIRKGNVFITRSGHEKDRSNIWRELKQLAVSAGVETEKVFPHNLRHLFAYTYYKAEKDIAHLADILGHSSINTTRIYTMGSGEEEMKQLSNLGLIVRCG